MKRTNVLQKSVCPKKLDDMLKAKFGGAISFSDETEFPYHRLVAFLEHDEQPEYDEYLTLLVALKITPNMLAPVKERKPYKLEFTESLASKVRQILYAHDIQEISTTEMARAVSQLIRFVIPIKNDDGTAVDLDNLVKTLVNVKQGNDSEDVASNLVQTLTNGENDENT